MQLKPMTAIAVLSLVVASLLTSGCTSTVQPQAVRPTADVVGKMNDTLTVPNTTTTIAASAFQKIDFPYEHKLGNTSADVYALGDIVITNATPTFNVTSLKWEVGLNNGTTFSSYGYGNDVTTGRPVPFFAVPKDAQPAFIKVIYPVSDKSYTLAWTL